ncbi:DUF397 domain-containing protein, partial [Actinomadura sp. 7K534]|uniref:DUF397 domain-containing protein n=1 Tax=Actinomadura sp. 7K534 TaxID=2530366 RepID=UPI00104ED797
MLCPGALLVSRRGSRPLGQVWPLGAKASPENASRVSCSGSANDDVCVELGRLAPGAGVGVRDSKDPDGGHLT